MNYKVLIKYLVQRGYGWILAERNKHIETAQDLSEQDKTYLKPYFELYILNSAKIDFVDHIENPPFYPELMKLKVPDLIDFTQMAGISFIDCILISRRFSHNQKSWRSLLFHEMVHLVQYYLLGTDKFAELYVKGWAKNNFIYEHIPLEAQAYNLQQEFEIEKNIFSVIKILQKQFKGII